MQAFIDQIYKEKNPSFTQTNAASSNAPGAAQEQQDPIRGKRSSEQPPDGQQPNKSLVATPTNEDDMEEVAATD